MNLTQEDIEKKALIYIYIQMYGDSKAVESGFLSEFKDIKTFGDFLNAPFDLKIISNSDPQELSKKLGIKLKYTRNNEKPIANSYFLAKKSNTYIVSDRRANRCKYIFYVKPRYKLYKTNYEHTEFIKATYKTEYVNDIKNYVLYVLNDDLNYEKLEKNTYDPFRKNFSFSEDNKGFLVLYTEDESGAKLYRDILFRQISDSNKIEYQMITSNDKFFKER